MTQQALLAAVTCKPGLARRVLFYDWGKITGWSFVNVAESGRIVLMRSGTIDLAKRFCDGAKLCWLDATVRAQVEDFEPHALGYEEAVHHRSHRAGEIYGGIRAVVLMRGVRANLPVHPIRPAPIKQRATGKGNADKAEMIVAAQELTKQPMRDHNEADALFGSLVLADLPAVHLTALSSVD